MDTKKNTKKFLENGSPLQTTIPILKSNKNIRLVNPDKLTRDLIGIGSAARICSSKGLTYTVWILDETTYNTIIIEIASHLMGSYFKQHEHGIFSHLAL